MGKSFEELLDLPDDVWVNLAKPLDSGAVKWIVFSGKLCSGKDTIAENLNLPGSTVLVSYGNILRENLKAALEALHEARLKGASLVEQVDILAKSLHYTRVNAGELLEKLYPLLTRGNGKLYPSPYERTSEMREILQLSGSDWLPTPDYLPLSAALVASRELNAGNNVVMAGSRFLPDVEYPRSVGAIIVRLDVTRETQLRRLKSRDGLELDSSLEAAFNHPGESALDDYDFDLRVDNNSDAPGSLERVVSTIHDYLNSRA